MKGDPERRKRVRESVVWLKGQKIDLDNVGPVLPFDTLAEHLAYQAERCRAEGYDEAEHVEVLLTALPQYQETLYDAEAELRQLGYASIASVLRRLAKRAKPKPQTIWEQRRRRFNLGVPQPN
jgi:hypothetical protein